MKQGVKNGSLEVSLPSDAIHGRDDDPVTSGVLRVCWPVGTRPEVLRLGPIIADRVRDPRTDRTALDRRGARCRRGAPRRHPSCPQSTDVAGRPHDLDRVPMSVVAGRCVLGHAGTPYPERSDEVDEAGRERTSGAFSEPIAVRGASPCKPSRPVREVLLRVHGRLPAHRPVLPARCSPRRRTRSAPVPVGR